MKVQNLRALALHPKENLHSGNVLEVAIVAVQGVTYLGSVARLGISGCFGGECFERRLDHELEVDAGERLQSSETFNALGLKVAQAFLLLQSKRHYLVGSIWLV